MIVILSKAVILSRKKYLSLILGGKCYNSNAKTSIRYHCFKRTRAIVEEGKNSYFYCYRVYEFRRSKVKLVSDLNKAKQNNQKNNNQKQMFSKHLKTITKNNLSNMIKLNIYSNNKFEEHYEEGNQKEDEQ